MKKIPNISYDLVQLVLVVFTMVLLLSKHYPVFKPLLSIFYKSQLSYVSVAVGIFALLHAVYMIIKGFGAKNVREIIEACIVVACGIILLSPEFNTVINIPIISSIKDINDEVISHLAWGLLPIVILYFVELFILNKHKSSIGSFKSS